MAKDQVAIEVIPQMNVKSIGGQPKLAASSKQTVFCGRFFGEVTAMKTKEQRNGNFYSYFVGEFRAIGPDGKHYSSEKLFLFGSLSEKIESMLKSSNSPVEFAVDIFATPSDKAGVGYVYASKSLIETAASDRIAKIAESLDGHALPSTTVKQTKK